MKKKVFKTSPLPFQGQKRRFASSFVVAMNDLKSKQEVKVIVDLFGGSGLLSHLAKSIFPDAKVVYNDFDNYSERLRNIDQTNKLLSDIRKILEGYPKGTKIEHNKRSEILKRIELADKSGYVDYITLSSSLMFSAKYVVNIDELRKENFYNNVKSCDYDFNPDEYLAGLEIVHCDYRELYNQYKDMEGVIFIVDPPYLSTDTKTYGSDKYWKLRDYLDVLKVLVGANYFFFTSNKSSLIELCEWFEKNKGFSNPFNNSVLNTQNVTLNKTPGYTDMMLYKFVK
ncbi:DNA adenine methylase [Dysgonomonas sp. 520]|uniref:DNA adenine methylase n=1 Tax=Dysgonomonas sp. 520 TaxID=2302931 RepID=UPI0013D09D34|nr:DNA adenine methylase [Dysgonomonas sp. 520]NDW09185.1 DNA adenine methylase [Dysgonomonas sp. 520]